MMVLLYLGWQFGAFVATEKAKMEQAFRRVSGVMRRTREKVCIPHMILVLRSVKRFVG